MSAKYSCLDTSVCEASTAILIYSIDCIHTRAGWLNFYSILQQTNSILAECAIRQLSRNQLPPLNISNQALHILIAFVSSLLEQRPMLLQPIFVVASLRNHNTLLPASENTALDEDGAELPVSRVVGEDVLPGSADAVAQVGVLLLGARAVVAHEARYAIAGVRLAAGV